MVATLELFLNGGFLVAVVVRICRQILGQFGRTYSNTFNFARRQWQTLFTALLGSKSKTFIPRSNPLIVAHSCPTTSTFVAATQLRVASTVQAPQISMFPTARVAERNAKGIYHSVANTALHDAQVVRRISSRVENEFDSLRVVWPKPRDDTAKPPTKARKTGKAYAKTVKKNKPTKSKRPLSAYNLFFRDQRDLVSILRRQMPPGETCPSIVKIISEQWKELTPQVRARYDGLAAEAKLRQYNEKQGWMDYSPNEPLLDGGTGGGEQDDIGSLMAEDLDWTQNCQGSTSIVAENQDDYDDTAWPWESIQGLAKELDPACIDFLIRNFA
eukprot:scaffold1690_cov182-Amphora_coffeaeformis.AAC.6